MTDDKDSDRWRKDVSLFRDVYKESHKRQSLKVLVVEDCEEDFFLVTRCLNAMPDYDVSITHAPEFDTGKSLFATEDFDLVVVDFWLGEKTGPHLLEALGGRTGKVPAILITGLEHPAYKHAALKSGAIQCVSKDLLTGRGLQDIVAGVLLTHRVENAPDEDRSANDIRS